MLFFLCYTIVKNKYLKKGRKSIYLLNKRITFKKNKNFNCRKLNKNSQ